jgi:hypothetical protein
METNKLKNLLLLDLSAFAATLIDHRFSQEAREEFESAYYLAKKQALPDYQTYEDFLERF